MMKAPPSGSAMIFRPSPTTVFPAETTSARTSNDETLGVCPVGERRNRPRSRSLPFLRAPTSAGFLAGLLERPAFLPVVIIIDAALLALYAAFVHALFLRRSLWSSVLLVFVRQ